MSGVNYLHQILLGSVFRVMDVNDDLIDRVLQGQATAEEIAEVQKWLKVPAYLERYALRAELHGDLRRSLRRRDIQNSALGASCDPEPSTTTSPSIFHSRQALMLTGVAIAACLIVAFIWPAADDAPGTAGALAAQVVSDANGLLTKSDVRWDDTNLPTGEYELQKGLLHLQFGGESWFTWKLLLASTRSAIHVWCCRVDGCRPLSLPKESKGCRQTQSLLGC